MGWLGEAAGHEGDHGPGDHGFVAGGQVLVVADGAPVLADPGEGSLHDPAAGQDLEGVQIIGTADDLEPEVQPGGPGQQPVCLVAAVGPDQPDVAVAAGQVPQQRPGGVAVLDGRGGDHHGQQQPGGVHGDVPLAAVDLLGVIPAPG